MRDKVGRHSSAIDRFLFRLTVKLCEQRFNGKPLDKVQDKIKKIILPLKHNYLRDENTARRLADNWNGSVQRPGNIRFIKNAVPVVLCANEKYAPYLAVMLQSLIVNSNPQRQYHFIIFGREFSAYTCDCLIAQTAGFPHCEIDIIDTRPVLSEIPLIGSNGLSADAYARLFIPYWLDEYERVIYLDSDMLVRADIAELYDLDIGGFCAGVCSGAEAGIYAERKKYGYFIKRTVAFQFLENWAQYINSGTMIFDTKKFRDKFPYLDFFKFAIYYTNRYAKRYNDQDILALSLKDEYYVLPQEWNYCWSIKREKGRYQPADTNVKIIHFTRKIKPWHKHELIDNNPDALEYRKLARAVPLFMDKVGKDLTE